MSVEFKSRNVIIRDKNGQVPDELIVQVVESGLYTYVGKALPGTAASSATWQIFRVTTASGTKLFANSTATFNKVWNDRASYTYG